MIYPDIEMALLDFLNDLGYTVTSTPFDMQTILATQPVIRVQRVSGDDDYRAGLDFPNVVIQVFVLRTAASPRIGHDMAESIRDRLNTINDDGGVYVDTWDALICDAQTVTGPVELAYLDPSIAVFQTTYRLTTKGR